jgi:carbonic anhydrase
VGVEQVAEFGRVVHGHNNRPVQALGGRMVTRYTAP